MLPLIRVNLPLVVDPVLRPTMITPAPPVVLNAAVGLLSVTTPLPELPIMKEPLSVIVQLLLTNTPPVPVAGFPMLTDGLPLAINDFAEAAFNRSVPWPVEVPLRNAVEPPPRVNIRPPAILKVEADNRQFSVTSKLATTMLSPAEAARVRVLPVPTLTGPFILLKKIRPSKVALPLSDIFMALTGLIVLSN